MTPWPRAGLRLRLRTGPARLDAGLRRQRFQLRVDDHRDGIATGSVVNHAFDVAGSEPLRATLVWTDYPAGAERRDGAGQRVEARGDRSGRQRLVPDARCRQRSAGPDVGRSAAARQPQHRGASGLRQPGRGPLGGPGAGAGRAMDAQPFALVVRGAPLRLPRPGSARGADADDAGRPAGRWSRGPRSREPWPTTSTAASDTVPAGRGSRSPRQLPGPRSSTRNRPEGWRTATR